MPNYVSSVVTTFAGAIFSGGGTNYVVQTTNGLTYFVAVDANVDLTVFISDDYGRSWNGPSYVISSSMTQISVWYDAWSDYGGRFVHVAHVNSSDDDIRYVRIDTENSSNISPMYTVYSGSSTAAGGSLSIVRSRGGNLGVAGAIDNGAEDGYWESIDTGSTWTAGGDPSEAATQDQYYLLPGWNADKNDLHLVFVDASANAISVKRYDDSANTWTETSIGSMTDVAASTSYPHVSVAPDLYRSCSVVTFWTGVDTANSHLRCYTIDDTNVTQKSNIVVSSSTECGFSALAINTRTNDWYSFYARGGTWNSNIGLFYKTSSDGGDSWSDEHQIFTYSSSYSFMYVTPRFDSQWTLCVGDTVRGVISITTAPTGSDVGTTVFR